MNLSLCKLTHSASITNHLLHGSLCRLTGAHWEMPMGGRLGSAFHLGNGLFPIGDARPQFPAGWRHWIMSLR